MSALEMGITAPCPFCGCKDAPEIMEDGNDVYAFCEDCLAQGPPTRIGCRDPEEEDIDLEREALELWNDRGHPEDEVTVEQIYDLCPALEASIAQLEAQDPEVRAVRKALDEEVTKLNARARLTRSMDGIRGLAERMKDSLTPKEREILERRTRGGSRE